LTRISANQMRYTRRSGSEYHTRKRIFFLSNRRASEREREEGDWLEIRARSSFYFYGNAALTDRSEWRKRWRRFWIRYASNGFLAFYISVKSVETNWHNLFKVAQYCCLESDS